MNQTQIQDLMKALWSGDVSMASTILSDLLWHTISYMDYHEDYYHAFLTGIFVGRGGYIVQSNKERGLGRPDVDLRDKPNRFPWQEFGTVSRRCRYDSGYDELYFTLEREEIRYPDGGGLAPHHLSLGCSLTAAILHNEDEHG